MTPVPRGKSDRLGAYMFSIVAIVGGAIAIITGDFRYWQAHVSGTNVRVGGALISLLGIVLLVSTIRETLRSRNCSHRAHQDESDR